MCGWNVDDARRVYRLRSEERNWVFWLDSDWGKNDKCVERRFGRRVAFLFFCFFCVFCFFLFLSKD